MKVAVGIAILALLTSCSGGPSPEAVAALEKLVDEGLLTPEQAQAMQDMAANRFDWGTAGREALRIAVELVLAYFGIRLWRGTPSNRKGTAPPAQ